MEVKEFEYISCPHHFRAAGIEGCTAGQEFNCLKCTHPDKKIEKGMCTAASTICELPKEEVRNEIHSKKS